MAVNEEVDRLTRRLNWEAGPLATRSNRATDALTATGRAFTSWMREVANDRPLISLLSALQIGFAVGRWGPRRAKH